MDPCQIVKRKLYCSYRLEHLVAKLLLTYAEKLKDSPKEREARAILAAIAIESSKHAELIDMIARLYNLYEEVDDCSQVIGMPWLVLQEFFEEVSSGRHIDLKKFIEKQIWLENAVGEETYHKLLLPLLSLKEELRNCADPSTLSSIELLFKKIALDEKWHEEMLKKIDGAIATSI
ncbi:MAG: hypothetical protein QW348_08420 [Ignisphaera sp.]